MTRCTHRRLGALTAAIDTGQVSIISKVCFLQKPSQRNQALPSSSNPPPAPPRNIHKPNNLHNLYYTNLLPLQLKE